MTAQDTASKVTDEFEQRALQGAFDIAQTFKKAAKQKQYKSWSMATAAMVTLGAPFLLGLSASVPLIMTVPALVMALALNETRKTQKVMQEGYEEMMQLVPEKARGIVNNELDTMETTLRSLTSEFSKKDIDYKKRPEKMMASGILLLMFPPLGIPSYLYLLLKEDSDKTTNLIRQADEVIDRNKNLLSQQPS